MGKEDDQNQTQRCSYSNNTSSGGGGGGIGNNNNNNGRSLKKLRPKKVPQRGLGVAQLEKMRIEQQQQKKDAVLISSSPTVCHKSIPSFHLSNQSSSSVPFPAHPNSIFKPPLSVQNIDNGHNFWSSGEYNSEKECYGLDPGLVSKTNLSLPNKSEPIWPLLSLLPRAQIFQQPSSSMVNNLTSRTSSSTSILNFQMEPPSNQSYYGNCTCLLPEEYKVIGMKRSYPLSLDNSPSHPSHSTFNGQAEAASNSRASTFNFEPGIPNLSDGEFLTLAPPTSNSMSSSSKLKHPQPNLINCELAYQPSFEIQFSGKVLPELDSD